MGCGSSTPKVQPRDSIVESDPDVEGAIDPNENPILFSRRVAGLQRASQQATRNSAGTLVATKPEKYSDFTTVLDPPTESLQLDYVFGFRGRDCRNNLVHLNAGTIVYNIAALGIVYDRATNRQRFYTGHNDDILCLAVHPAKNLVATGQIGKNPMIHLWDPTTMQKVNELRGHVMGVLCVAFSPDGRYVASSGADDEFTVIVHDVATGAIVTKQSAGRNKILSIRWDPMNPNTFAVVGVKLVKFFTIDRTVAQARGLLGDQGEYQTFPCCEYAKNGTLCVGTAGGQVYVFRGKNLTTVRPVNSPVTAMAPTADGLLVFTQNRNVFYFKGDSAPTQAASGQLPLIVGEPRAIDILGTSILVGTAKNEILAGSLDLASATVRDPQILQAGHFDELWGLTMCPMNPNHALTAGDDGAVRRWDIVQNRMLDKIVVDGKSRVVAISPDGTQMVVGTENGKVFLVNPQTGAVGRNISRRTRQISELKFSPCGTKLAVGTHESQIDVYAMPEGNLVGSCTGHSSYITHLDWAKDGSFFRTNCGAYELLFWNPTDCKQITDVSPLKNVEYATQHCVIAPLVTGMWPEASDGTDINAIDVHPGEQLMVMGDDFRMVELARFPCMDKSTQKKKFGGHSEHVTNVRWTRDGQTVVSCGGLDAGVFVWRLR